MRRYRLWLAALPFCGLGVWALLRWLPASPVDAALRELASPDATQRRAALRRLQDALPTMALPHEQRRQLTDRLVALAEHDPNATVRLQALALLPMVQAPIATVRRLALRALKRSAAEAYWATEVLPQVADATTWERLMDAYERRTTEHLHPVQRDRLVRLLRQLPPTHWRRLCRRIGQRLSVWQPIVAGLRAPSAATRRELVRCALSDDAAMREGALLLLTRFPPDPQEAAHLAPLAHHPDPKVREAVFRIFAQAPSRQILAQLKAALNAPPPIAHYASIALLRLGSLHPEEGRKLLKRPDAVLRAQGALALAPSDDERDFQQLCAALHDADLEVVRTAAAALAAKGTKGITAVLRFYRAEPRPERRAALLGGIAGVAHPQVIATLVAALKGGDWRERAVALSGLALQRDKALPAIEALAQSPHREERLAAVDALNAIGTPAALKKLLRLAQTETDPQVQAQALTTLSNRRVKEALPLLAQALRSKDTDLASCAAFGLTRYGAQGRGILRDALQHTSDPQTRHLVARALAIAGDKAGMSELTRRLSANLSEDQRIALLQSLARAGDPKALQELVELLGSDRPLTRLRARAALFAVGGLAVPALMNALNDANPRRRAEAALLLGALRATVAREKLVALTADNDPQVRDAAQRALARLDVLPLP